MVDLEPLRPLLAQQYIVLTPNRRLAHRIRQGVLQELPQGEVGVTPAVFALGEWLERLWLDWLAVAEQPELVLNDAQESWLWQQVIRDQAAGMSWLRPGAVAQQAAVAYRQLLLWRVDPDQPSIRSELATGPDSAAFLEWCDAFRDRARREGWLTTAERDQRIVEQLHRGGIHLSRPIASVAFDDVAPLYQHLFSIAPDWRPVSLSGAPAVARIVAADDPDDEIRQACRWLRARLDLSAAAGAALPVALVVPDLGQRRARIERLLAEEWEPAGMAPAAGRSTPWINISAGVPLADTPLAVSGLRLLGLWQDRLSRPEAIALAQCPFSGPAFGDARAAAWIEAVCELGTAELSGAQLRHTTQNLVQQGEVWGFAEALQRTAESARRLRIRRDIAPLPEWRRRFDALLRDWGWPARSLDSIEYQQHQHWREALDAFAALDVVAGAVDLQQALTALRQILQRAVFQPRIEDGQLHVLGLLETAGLRFGAAWVCGMGAGQWPAPAAPHPLLPRRLQRRLRMPHCDAARELDFSERISQGLLGCSGELRISYARERDAVAQTISPLFSDIAYADLPAGTDAESQPVGGQDASSVDRPSGLLQAWIEAGTTALEVLPASDAPPVSEAERPRGGSAIFQSQAECPFSAFARHRLDARPLAGVSAGPTALDRGQLLHRSLELIWRKLGRHSALAALSSGQRRARVAEAVATALDEWLGDRGWQIRTQLRRLEQTRLETLLDHWLETVELAREEFVVVAVEQNRSARFGPLELQLRADRIDRLADGRDLIIDYKSGRAQPGDWFGDRPSAPQLPLYATLAEEEKPGSIAAIAFAQLRAEGSQLRGLGEAGPVDRLEGDWSHCKAGWRATLERLAADFINGRAEVDPKQPPQTCRYCAIAPVCRYHHQSPDDQPLAEEGQNAVGGAVAGPDSERAIDCSDRRDSIIVESTP